MKPTELIDEYISGITDWRGSLLAKLCRLVREGGDINGEALKDLLRAAVRYNRSQGK